MKVASPERSTGVDIPDLVLAKYQEKHTQLEADITVRRRQQVLALVATGIAAVLSVVGFIALNSRPISLLQAAIAFGVAVWAFRLFLSFREESYKLGHLASFYERGLDRLRGVRPSKGNNGTNFARKNHLYQWDLAIIGENSLFEFICTTRSEVGAARLASFLLESTTLEEAVARQTAVKELKDAASLREEIALLGKYQFLNCDTRLRAWLGKPQLVAHRSIAPILFGSSTAFLITIILASIGLFSWSYAALLLGVLLIIQGSICKLLKDQIGPHLRELRTFTNEFDVLRQGIELIQRQHFHSAKLRQLTKQSLQKNAISKIRTIERLVRAIEKREDPFFYYFYAPSFLLAIGTQLVLAVERWIPLYKEDLTELLDTWAEFEALNALGCYSYEHPTDPFPELLEGQAKFEFKDMRHPLLPAGCVGNDVALNSEVAVYIISGSNMAGKSTLLRAIGMNSILAAAGAPVRAISARTSIFSVCASISISDSLVDGKSKFRAEVERLREAIRCTDLGGPVLFLIDEILSGTNSQDRKVAAKLVVKALTEGRAIGALSTHDLALAEIAAVPEFRSVNVHMQSENPDDPLEFDYRLKQGIATLSNGIAIVKMMGIEV